jgi:hypothetical protein
VATLPAYVARRAGDDYEPAPDHPANALLSDAWNPWTDSYSGMLALVTDALTRDDGGFGWVNRVNGKPAEIIRYQPGMITARP